MSLPVAPELFDILIEYAKKMKMGWIKPQRSLAASSAALTFCENFYAQFFQNVLGTEIKHFGPSAKQAAVGLRLEAKEKGDKSEIIQLITWYEKLCDDYSTVLALGYGGGTKAAFFDFHENYLLSLLKRAAAWAGVAQLNEIEVKAQQALSDLKQALESIPR